MNSMEIMARNERSRIKHAIFRALRCEGYFEWPYKTRAKIVFLPAESMGPFFNGYTPAERREIVRELTLEIIDELIDGLTSTKKWIQSGGEI